MKSCFFALACVASATMGATAQGQVTYEDGPDGMRYQVTHSVTQQSIPVTEYQQHEQKVYHPQVTTQYQSYQQTYLTPVTQYQWEPHLRNPLGILGTPYWTHELRPVTRWEARPATVQVPVASTNWVEEKRTVQVPVTSYKTVQNENVDRRAIGPSPTGASAVASSTSSTPMVASRPIGGQQLQSDPPRSQSPWNTSTSGAAYR
jgi:hypothetical protein